MSLTKIILKTLWVICATAFISFGAQAQSWNPVGSAAVAGHWNSITCNTTANGTWQALGCFSCPSGWSLSGSNCIQTQAGTTIPPTAGVCPANFSLVSGSCVPNTIGATANYTCANGTLQGNTCVIAPTPFPATPFAYYCSGGYGKLSGTSCVTGGIVPATPVYTCSGGSLRGSLCNISTTYAATPSYSCPSGGSLSGGTCTVLTTYVSGVFPNMIISYIPSSYGATVVSYSCNSGGTNNGNGTCTITSTSVASVSSYTCYSGTLSGNMCSTQVNTPATPVYCALPSTQSGSTCVWPNAAPTVASYSCPSGYFLSGSSCIPPYTATVPATGGPSSGF